MSLRTRRAVRLLVAVAFTWVGLALFAHAALAWEAKIQVAKVNEGGAANDAFVFQPTLTSTSGSAIAAPFSLKGGELTAPFDVRCNAGNDCFSDLTQRVTEQPTPGYTLKDVSCRYTQGTNGNFADPPGPSSPLTPASEVSTDLATGTVDVKAHFLEWVLCTFTNAPVVAPPLPVPIAAPSAPAPAPQIQVSPARVRPGSATLRGPTACLTSDVVVARVTGRRIVRVSFYVENRKVKTLHKPNRGSAWMLSARVPRLPAHGPYRVRARVEFAASSQTKPKTLRMAVSRCRSTAVRPQFT